MEHSEKSFSEGYRQELNAQKAYLDMEKHGGVTMMLARLIVRSYERSGNRETQVRRSI